MAVSITCPECQKRLTVSAETVGKNIRCPACKASFVAEEGEAEPAAGSAIRKAAPGRGSPSRRDEQGVRETPAAARAEAPRRRQRADEDEEEEERPRPKRKKA